METVYVLSETLAFTEELLGAKTQNVIIVHFGQTSFLVGLFIHYSIYRMIINMSFRNLNFKFCLMWKICFTLHNNFTFDAVIELFLFSLTKCSHIHVSVGNSIAALRKLF